MRRPAPERRPSESQTAGTRSWRPQATGLVNVRRRSGERYVERRPSSYGGLGTRAGGSGSGGHAPRRPPPPPQYSFLPPPPFHGRPPSPIRRTQHEQVFEPESRPSSPILRAESTADDLFDFFGSLPPPLHLQHRPKEAIVSHWTNWLIRVRGIDYDNARTMAEVYVDERWKGGEVIPRRDMPMFQPPIQQDIDSPWIQREQDPGNSRPFPPDTETVPLPPNNNDIGRPQPRWSVPPLRETQPSRTRDNTTTPSPSPAAGHRRVYSEPPPFDFRSPSQNPFQESNEPTPAPGSEPTSHWHQTTDLPPSSPNPTPPLQTHLTHAIHSALATNPLNHNLDTADGHLYLDARFRVPIAVARAGGVDWVGCLSGVGVFVPVGGGWERAGDGRRVGKGEGEVDGGQGGEGDGDGGQGGEGGQRQQRRTSRTAEELAREEEEGWERVRARGRKRWSY